MSQQHADLLAALQFTHFSLVERFIDAQSIEQDGGIAVGCIAVLFSDNAFEFAETHAVLVGQFVMRFCVELFALLQRFPEPAIAHDDGVDDAIGIESELILTKHSELFGPGDRTL